jgi:hypothetical protein
VSKVGAGNVQLDHGGGRVCTDFDTLSSEDCAQGGKLLPVERSGGKSEADVAGDAGAGSGDPSAIEGFARSRERFGRLAGWLAGEQPTLESDRSWERSRFARRTPSAPTTWSIRPSRSARRSSESWSSALSSSRPSASSRCSSSACSSPAAKRHSADRCPNYLLSKRPHLDYPTALTHGWPIATGVIEGACRHLVKDRMDITGARWGLDTAEAVLKLRAIRSNGNFDEYWAYHLAQERRRVHETRYAHGIIPRSE